MRYYGGVKLLRSLVITIISLHMNQIKGADSSYFIQTSASVGIVKDEGLGATLKTEQNSPMTLTAGLTYELESFDNLSVLSKGSVSYLIASDIEQEGGSTFSNDTKLAPEFGASLHLLNSNFFGGVDLESFSLYAGLPDAGSNAIHFISEKLTYTTLGISFKGQLITPYVFKVSASQSLSSDKGFSGQRYIVAFEQEYSENIWYHVFAKRHSLENGGRQISISRYGVGLGFHY